MIEANPASHVKLRVLLDLPHYSSDDAVRSAFSSIDAELLDITRSDEAWIVRLEGNALAAREVVLLPGCLWVERFVDFQLHNNLARTSSNVTTGRGSQAGPIGPIMDVEDVWARGIHGEGQIAAAADTGLSTGNLATLHLDFGQQGSATNPLRVIKGYALGRTTWDDNQSIGGGHGTHTSGSIIGNGFRSGATPDSNSFPSAAFAGNAPKAQFVFQSVMDSLGGLGGLPSDLTLLFQPPYNDGARVHSNSWGAAVAGAYNTDAQAVDKFIWDHKDMIITFSAGNSGVDGKSSSCLANGNPIDGVIDTDSIGSPGTAKNCITVGASENYRPIVRWTGPRRMMGEYSIPCSGRKSMPIEEFIISVYCEVCIPMPVCNFGLAPSSEAFRGEAAHGRRALKKETYYGFKGLVMIAADGIIVWHRFCRRQNNYSNREI